MSALLSLRARLPSPCRHIVLSQWRRGLTVLALESSADDTCAAVVTSERRILSNVVVKQNELHEKYSGIEPITAILAHQRNMPGAIQKALSQANLTMADIDGIAYTRGPGMPGCLNVCSGTARALAAALGKPSVGVHHMQGHALTPMLTMSPEEPGYPTFPFLSLLVSGGHTLILLAESKTRFRTLATTADISIGRAYDKVTKLLRLPWTRDGPGATLEHFAGMTAGKVPDAAASLRPGRVMPGRLAFSYSSLVSYVERYLAARDGDVSEEEKRALAQGFQAAAADQLGEKLGLAIRWCESRGIDIRQVVVAGGVARNVYLLDRLRMSIDKAGRLDIQLAFPPQALCTDNAAMIAWAAMHRFLAGDHDDYSQEILREWSIDTLDQPTDPKHH